MIMNIDIMIIIMITDLKQNFLHCESVQTSLNLKVQSFCGLFLEVLKSKINNVFKTPCIGVKLIILV